MARKIKFALEMSDGTKVRSNIEELREHFDIKSIMEHFLSGKLQEWLEDRYYEAEAEQLTQLNRDSTDIYTQICKILGVEPPSNENINLESIKRLNEKKSLLRQLTEDENIIEHVAQVAFNQEELANLIDQNTNIIYLCGKQFTLPSKVTNITYIGLNKPHISINIKSHDELVSKNITIKNAIFPENISDNVHKPATIKTSIQQLSLYERTKQLYGKEEADAEKKYLECNYDNLFNRFIKLSEQGIERANYFIIQMQAHSFDTAPLEFSTDNQARIICQQCSDILAKVQGAYSLSQDTFEFENFVSKLYISLKKLADEGDPFACFELYSIYESGFSSITKSDAIAYLNKAHQLGNMDATNRLGMLSYNSNDYSNAFQFYEIASKAGHPTAQNSLGWLYESGLGIQKNSQKAFNLGQNSLGNCYYSGNEFEHNPQQAVYWYTKAAEKNYAVAQDNLGNCFRYGCGVEQDITTAIHYYQLACQQKYAWAQCHLGDIYINNGDYESTNEGINLLNSSISQGNTLAMKILANYYKGFNFISNANEYKLKAEELYQKAADLNDDEAISYLKGLKDNELYFKLKLLYNKQPFDSSTSLIQLEYDANIYKSYLFYSSYTTHDFTYSHHSNIYDNDKQFLISTFCPNLSEDNIILLSTNYDSNDTDFDTSSGFVLTTNSIILHDTNDMLFQVKKSLFGSNENPISDCIISYRDITDVIWDKNKKLTIKYADDKSIFIKTFNKKAYDDCVSENKEIVKTAKQTLDRDALNYYKDDIDFMTYFKVNPRVRNTYIDNYTLYNPNKRAENIGCWILCEDIAYFLSTIIKRKREFL